VSDSASIGAGSFGGTAVPCPAGQKLLGGGFNTANSSLNATTNRPIPGEAWEAGAYNASGGTLSIQVYAVCGTVGA
jgi:hypothetical protein